MSQEDFYWSEEGEPHLIRRKQILKKYPEVRELYGVDPALKYKVLMLVTIQLSIAPVVFNLHWAIALLITYVIGATITHSLFLAIHEISHNLAFRKKTLNYWFGMVANIPIVFPYAMSFRTYHLMHHNEQGHDHRDNDIPTEHEARIFKGIFGKLIWLANQVLFYAVRPLLMAPLKPTKWHVINFVFQFTAIGIYIWFAGWNALLFLLLSFFFAGSLHPMAGHFISEHFVVDEGQETYSYYGPLNKLGFNVGYHNEHHDFPYIPGSRLPELKKLAGEYYDPLYAHDSWVKVMYHFVTDKKMGLYSRVKRNKVEKEAD